MGGNRKDCPKKSMKRLHDPVLVMEVIEALQVRNLAHLKKRGKFIDATVGLGE